MMLPHHGHREARARGQAHLAHRHGEVFGRGQERRVVREAVLRFRHAHGQVPVAVFLELGQRFRRRGLEHDVLRMVHALREAAQLVRDGRVLFVGEMQRAVLHDVQHGPPPARGRPSPPLANTSLSAHGTPSLRSSRPKRRAPRRCRWGTRSRPRTRAGRTPRAGSARGAPGSPRPSPGARRSACPAPSWGQPPWCLSARTVATTTAADGAMPAMRHLMSRNFSAPRSAPKPASVTTMSPSFMARRVAMTLLHPCAMFANGPPWISAGVCSSVCTRLGSNASFKSAGHGPRRAQLAGGDGLALVGVGHHDARKARLQIGKVAREAENGHHLAGDGDVEAVLARHAVHAAAQAVRDEAQLAVVHIDAPLPGDAPRVDVQRVALVDVVVEHGGQQVVGRADGVQIAGEVQVDVLHGHHLRIAAAGRAALDAEHGPRGWARAAPAPRACPCGAARRPGPRWWWFCPRPRAWGLMAVTSTTFASGFSAMRRTRRWSTFAL